MDALRRPGLLELRDRADEADSDADPGATLLQEELRRTLDHAIQHELTERQRDIITLQLSGLSAVEISTLLNICQGPHCLANF